LSAAKQLAAKGANIILVARNVQKLQSTIEDVKVTLTLLLFPLYPTPRAAHY
jgi:short-subunit dehydrogenase